MLDETDSLVPFPFLHLWVHAVISYLLYSYDDADSLICPLCLPLSLPLSILEIECEYSIEPIGTVVQNA
jgi:hypothetical protein